MNQLQKVFQYEGAQVRTLTIEGKPYFVMRDVCDILDLGNVTESSRRLDADEFSSAEVIDASGRSQMTIVVNEPGLYSLILGSRKKETRNFKRWVTHEVLPAIRKTGSYVAPATTPEGAMMLALEATKQNMERLSLVESDLAEVKHELTNHVTITTREQARVQFAVKGRIAELLGGYGSAEYVAHRSQHFAGLYGEIKRRFGVPSYKDLRRQDLEPALNYITAWVPRMVS